MNERREQQERADAVRESLEAKAIGQAIQADARGWEVKEDAKKEAIRRGEVCLLWGRKAMCVERRAAQRLVRLEDGLFEAQEDEAIRLAVELEDGTLGEHTVWASDVREAAE